MTLYPPSDFRRFLSQFSTDVDEILQGLFSGHATTFIKKKLYSSKVRPFDM